MTGTFDINAALLALRGDQKPYVRDLYGTKAGLRFLIGDEVTPKWSVVFSDLSDVVEAQIDLPGDNNGFAADDSGRIVAYSPERGGKGSFVMLADARSPIRLIPAAFPVFAFCVLPERLVALRWDGRIAETSLTTGSSTVAQSGPLNVTDPDLQRPIILRPLPSGFMIVDQGAATITLGEPGAGYRNTIRLLAPEIEKAHATYEQERQAFAKARPGARLMTGVVAWGVAADQNGDIYVGVRPFQPSDGATVLRFSRMGALVQSPRCPLPSTQFEPTCLGIAGSQLFLAEPRGLVAVYQL